MIPKRSPRFLALLIAGTLVGALFASPALAAKPPRHGGTATAVPGTVGPSTDLAKNYARFDVVFTNTRNSSLQQVTIEAATPAGSDLEAVVAGPLVNGVSQGTCDAGGANLTCTIGTVVAGAVVTLSVVYEIPVTTATSMDVSFIFKSTGAPGTDPGTSHGDDFPVNGSVVIDSTDFDGGYLFDAGDLVVETNQVLSKRGNPQSTRINGPASGIPVTASEVAANQFVCPEGVECFGQWSVLNVNNDTLIEDGFTVVIGYDAVPGNSGDVGFVHLVGGGSTFITESCGGLVTMNCIVDIDSVNGDLYYTLLIDNNGPIRGI